MAAAVGPCSWGPGASGCDPSLLCPRTDVPPRDGGRVEPVVLRLHPSGSLNFSLGLACFFLVLPFLGWFLFFSGPARGLWKFPEEGSNLCHSSDPNRCSDSARSLTPCAARELPGWFLGTPVPMPVLG